MPQATIQLSNPAGIWRPVYARRKALHATADTIVLAAWKADLDGLDLAPAVAAWRMAVGETSVDLAGQHRQQAAAAAVLAVLAAQSWQRTRAALTLAAQRAHLAGWAAGHALTVQDRGDDADFSDEPDIPYSIGSPRLSDNAAQGTAAAVLTAALATAARRAGRAMADGTDTPVADAEGVIDAAADITLATDTAVSAAYGQGLLSAYLAAGRQSVDLITAGDGRVCAACQDAEDNSPYALLDAPRIPLHPRCRCVLAPN